MAYEDTCCPCGGKKERETMLCTPCVEHLSERPEMKAFRDSTNFTVQHRRSCAIALITLARRRKHTRQ